MQTWIVEDEEFHGGVKLSSQRSYRFYKYSLWRAGTGEHLFDGAAGDLAEAVESLLAHIHFLAGTKPGALAAAD